MQVVALRWEALILIVGTLLLPLAEASRVTSAGWVDTAGGVPVDLSKVVAGNGRFVAVGGEIPYPETYGVILFSRNGREWSVARTSSKAWYGLSDTCNEGYLAFGNGRFLVVDSSGACLTSTDGENWTDKTPISDRPGAVYFGNGVFIVLGDKAVYTSTDASRWAASAYPAEWKSISAWDAPSAFGGGKVLMLRRSRTSEGAITGDFTHWTSTTLPTPSDSGTAFLAYANGYFIWMRTDPTRSYAVSSDGLNWTELALPAGLEKETHQGASLSSARSTSFRMIHAVDDQFWLVSFDPAQGSCVIRTSRDGANWQVLSRNAPMLNSVVHNDVGYVGVGPMGGRYYSSDGIRWSSSKVTDSDITLLTYFKGRWLAVDFEGRLYTSPDAVKWTNEGAKLSASGRRQAAQGNGRIVVTSTGDTLAWSADGITWTERHTTVYGTQQTWYGVAYGSGVFIACDVSGLLARSVDGENWMFSSSPWFQTGIGYGGDQFIGVAGKSGLTLSKDGTNWSLVSTSIPLSVGRVAYGGGTYCVIDEGARGAVSFDGGRKWSQSVAGVLYDILWTGDRFIAVGDQGEVQSSITGNGWSFDWLFGGAIPKLRTIATDGYQVLAGGTAGALVRVADAAALFARQPESMAVVPSGRIELAAAVYEGTAPTLQWTLNGAALAAQTGATLTISNLHPENTGLYSLVAKTPVSTVSSDPAIVGLLTTGKVIGNAEEVASNVYVAASRNTYDQILLSGSSAAVTSDLAEHQVTRISYIDLDDDIVQVEFSGPGTLSLVVDGTGTPALPAKYNQEIRYVKGHAGVVLSGATVDTNLTVFSVGRTTAVNSALFRSDTTYDGVADLAFVAISSSDGKFGGLRLGNVNFFNSRGFTGIYAPGIEFTGPVYVGEVTAFDAARPVIVLGSATEARVTGGSFEQANGAPVQVSGIGRLRFTAGTDSHGTLLPARVNRATLRQNGRDVTAEIVSNP